MLKTVQCQKRADGLARRKKKSFRHSDLGVIFVAIKLALRPGFSPAAARRALWLPPLRSGVRCWLADWREQLQAAGGVVSGQVVWSSVDVNNGLDDQRVDAMVRQTL